MTSQIVIQPKSDTHIIKLLGIGALSIAINYLISNKLSKKKQQRSVQRSNTLSKNLSLNQFIDEERSKIDLIKSRKNLKVIKKDETWGSVKLINDKMQDPLMKQLKLMDSLLCEVSRVNNLIVDLQLTEFKPHPNYLLAKTIKKKKQEPFLGVQALVTPGEFVIKQCKFTPANTLQLQKKYMRAGPRASEFFFSRQVRADIVCLGGVCPGINTVIRELTIILKDVYHVQSVTGVKNSFKGYYDRKFIDLNYQIVETIHHFGGSFLGLCQTEFYVDKVIDSLIQRKINQVYLIGANKTMMACSQLHAQIKRRKLPITICVLLKGINRDVPTFDSCFGFQTAVEESSKILQKAYSFSHSQQNGVSIVKLSGYTSGFLACSTVLSTVNANFCIVPEFQFDMYGPSGLLAAICWRVKQKKSCTLVYSEGAQNALRDCCVRKGQKWESITEFDNFLRGQIQQSLKRENLVPYHVGVFNAVEIAKSSPANSLDTKLCCQIAQGCVMGMMAGYTNFAVGHLASKSAMISIPQLLLTQSVTQLKQSDELWQQTLMTTNQPRLLNDNLTMMTPHPLQKQHP